MENVQQTEYREINTLLTQSLAENDYSPLTDQDMMDA
jgi:hypothetical protein